MEKDEKQEMKEQRETQKQKWKKENKKELPGGELNPGQPCDRRLY